MVGIVACGLEARPLMCMCDASVTECEAAKI